MSEAQVMPSQDGRADNGRFLTGNKLGKGNTSERINLPRLAKKKAKEMGLDINELLWDVFQAMFLRASCGDTKAAKLLIDTLGETQPKGPLVAIDMTHRVPQAPPLEVGPDGAPPLGEHLARLTAIAKERGLFQLADLVDAHPADVVSVVAEKNAKDDLMS